MLLSQTESISLSSVISYHSAAQMDCKCQHNSSLQLFFFAESHIAVCESRMWVTAGSFSERGGVLC